MSVEIKLVLVPSVPKPSEVPGSPPVKVDIHQGPEDGDYPAETHRDSKGRIIHIYLSSGDEGPDAVAA